MRIQAKLTQKIAPFMGINFQRSNYQAGLVLRAPLNQEASFSVRSSARVLGSIAALDFTLPVYASLYYDPWSLEWTQNYETKDLKLSLALLYKVWKTFQSPTLRIEHPDTTQCSPACGTQFAETKLSSLDLNNQWIPKLQITFKAESHLLSFSYAYLPRMISTDHAWQSLIF
jgi:hypothetical protein